MHAMHDTNCDERNKACNVRVRKAWESESVRESEVKAWESERERGRAKSNNMILRARDEVRSLETRSELQ
jgi:hypothetical protein